MAVAVVAAERLVEVLLEALGVAVLAAVQVLLELRIRVVVEAVVREQAEKVKPAAQASSSSNTQHPLNPYLHSKVLVSGLHLLA